MKGASPSCVVLKPDPGIARLSAPKWNLVTRCKKRDIPFVVVRVVLTRCDRGSPGVTGFGDHIVVWKQDMLPVPGAGPWSLVPGPWSLVPGPWSLVPGPWSLVPGPRSLVPEVPGGDPRNEGVAPGLWGCPKNEGVAPVPGVSPRTKGLPQCLGLAQERRGCPRAWG